MLSQSESRGSYKTLSNNNSSLSGSTNEGTVILKAEERKQANRASYRLRFEGTGFTSDYLFYRLCKPLQRQPQDFVPIYESETPLRSSNGKHEFKDANIQLAALFPREDTQPALLEVFAWYPELLTN
jgi:hypothetical protein